MDPPFYVLSSGDESSSNSPNTSLSGSSHDSSSAKYHIQDVKAFAEDLNQAAKSAFPNRGRSRYDTINACLIRWEQDELNVHPELNRLNDKFQDYGFATNTWLIPSRDSHLELMSKAIDLIRASDNDRNLFIVYYAGHGRINNARQAEWTCNRDPNYASVDWSAIQSLFAKAKSDVLILLDTCAAASSTMRSRYGVMEAIVACGFESRAAPPGEYSFTNTLIEVLDDWQNKRSFSASCLHAEILFQLKLKENRKGREGIKLEWCSTPIHINYTHDSKAPGIELCQRNVMSPPANSDIFPDRRSTFIDAMDLDIDDTHTTPSPLLSLSASGEFQTPHVLIRIGLEQQQPPMDVKQCLRWLENIPILGKWATIEGVYPSYSTLLIISVPIVIWNMLPDNPACSFVGYAAGPCFTRCLPELSISKATKITAADPAHKLSAPNCAGSVTQDAVSPELIAAITEHVKRELFEHLKHIGSGDDMPRAPPLHRARAPSIVSSSPSSPPPTPPRVGTPPSLSSPRQLKEYPEDHVFVAWRKRESQPQASADHASSVTQQPELYGQRFDPEIGMERERKPCATAPNISRRSSPPLPSFSRSSDTVDSGYHEDYTTDIKKKWISLFSHPLPGPPPGPPPLYFTARRVTDRYGSRGTEDERFVPEINSPWDAVKWDQYQESLGIS